MYRLTHCVLKYLMSKTNRQPRNCSQCRQIRSFFFFHDFLFFCVFVWKKNVLFCYSKVQLLTASSKNRTCLHVCINKIGSRIWSKRLMVSFFLLYLAIHYFISTSITRIKILNFFYSCWWSSPWSSTQEAFIVALPVYLRKHNFLPYVAM